MYKWMRIMYEREIASHPQVQCVAIVYHHSYRVCVLRCGSAGQLTGEVSVQL